jgi:hypothetical protein
MPEGWYHGNRPTAPPFKSALSYNAKTGFRHSDVCAAFKVLAALRRTLHR